MLNLRSSVSIVGALAFSVLAAVIAYALADTYIARLPDHRGLYLVAVEDEVPLRPASVPRKTIVVVVDGLRQDSARGMSSVARLARAGHCRPSNTGSLTISRPVYTLLSTGLEQDRTGSRNNDETVPVVVQSIWELARDAGLRVHVASNLSWWAELFPRGFDRSRVNLDESVNLFVPDDLGDLTLIHPVRVDTAGHEHGAASADYKEAVTHVDEELSAFIDSIDLEQDILVFTADHGHSNSGGHGGISREIAEVLTCFAGPGIRRRSDSTSDAIDSRIIAPTIAVLLGLPFPKHMRATDDGLDEMWSVVDEGSLGRTYVRSRKAGIEHFRSVNQKRIGEWLGQDKGTWSELYDARRRIQYTWWFAFTLLVTLAMAYSMHRRELSVTRAMQSLLWMAIVLTSCCCLYAIVRGSFDFTSINKRQEFLDASLAIGFSVETLGLGLHFLMWRDLRALLWDQVSMVGLLLAVALAHPMIYGVPLGFPLPGPIAVFLPFILGALIICGGILGALIGILQLAPGVLRWLRDRSR